MASLIEKPRNELPCGYFGSMDYLWLYQNGRVYKRRRHVKGCRFPLIHAKVWGGEAWNNELRGYYDSSSGVVFCHSRMTPELVRKIAKKFQDAIYYVNSDGELI
jgi:hypothetical protein